MNERTKKNHLLYVAIHGRIHTQTTTFAKANISCVRPYSTYCIRLVLCCWEHTIAESHEKNHTREKKKNVGRERKKQQKHVYMQHKRRRVYFVHEQTNTHTYIGTRTTFVCCYSNRQVKCNKHTQIQIRRREKNTYLAPKASNKNDLGIHGYELTLRRIKNWIAFKWVCIVCLQISFASSIFSMISNRIKI